VACDPSILDLLPHRPPFLWVDRIVSRGQDHLVAEKDIPTDLDLFQGHFPGQPIMPGVLLCEAVFQAGAMLLALAAAENRPTTALPVLTRIHNARFKRQVMPGDTITLDVRIIDREGGAWFLKGKVEVGGKKAVSVEFACTMLDPSS
jgi:3-hydroxyacyl-[acyl-carrier-protein] dehydratase